MHIGLPDEIFISSAYCPAFIWDMLWELESASSGSPYDSSSWAPSTHEGDIDYVSCS